MSEAWHPPDKAQRSKPSQKLKCFSYHDYDDDDRELSTTDNGMAFHTRCVL